MIPPFLGTKVVTDIPLDEVYPLINTRALFTGQWQFRRTSASEEAYQELLKQKAWPAFEEWKERCKDEKILEPRVVYGYFETREIASLTLAMTEPLNHRTIAPTHDFVPLQLVTVGDKVVQKCQWLFAAHQYADYLYLHGLAVVTTEALAEYWHKRILRELGIEIPLHPPFLKGERGGLPRISPGYPAWPNLADQKELYRLLGAERIGVKVTETYQLVPEYSTSAMIIT